MLVPKATVNKEGQFDLREYKVGYTGQSFPVKAKPIPMEWAIFRLQAPVMCRAPEMRASRECVYVGQIGL